jgi:hypothetical protein
LVSYLYDENSRDSQDDDVTHIRNLLDFEQDRCWFIFCAPVGPEEALGRTTAALTEWAMLVCSNCEWDHKPLIRNLVGASLEDNDTLYVNVPGTPYRLNHEIWSNIHYGYVGTHAGFDEATRIH